MSIEDQPKKIQYLTIDSQFVNGTNNIFSVDLTMSSNVQMEGMSKVIGIKLVDFYITQIGDNDAEGTSVVAKYVDIVCKDIPKISQILDERVGQLFARIPLERSFSGSSGFMVRDKQWKSFGRVNTYFNPISIKQLNFEIYEDQGNGNYVTLQPDATFYMVLEITTLDHKDKPKDKNVQILKALEKLHSKLDELNSNVKRLPEKEPQKYPFGYLFALIIIIMAVILYFLRKRT